MRICIKGKSILKPNVLHLEVAIELITLDCIICLYEEYMDCVKIIGIGMVMQEQGIGGKETRTLEKETATFVLRSLYFPSLYLYL